MSDKKKIVFRVITENENADAAYVVRVLSRVAGVQSVAFDERSSLATVIGDFDVDGIVAESKEDGIRLRVRDIDVNYEPEPEPEEKISPTPACEQERSVETDNANTDAQEPQAEKSNENDEPFSDSFYDDTDDEYALYDAERDDADEEEQDEDDDETDEEDENDSESDEEDDDEDDDEDDEDDEEYDDEPRVQVTDRPSFTDILGDWGSKLNDALDRGAKAISGAGKKIADFADNVFTKTCDLGGSARGGTQVKSMPDRYPVPYAELRIAAKFVTENNVEYFEGSGLDADRLKTEAREKLPDEFGKLFIELLDGKFTGKYKYVKDGAAFKLSVKPKI